MEPAWEASWAWGLGFIALTTAAHAFGVVMLTHGLLWSVTAARKRERMIRHSVALAAGIIGIVGCVLAIFHGIEAAIWAGAYMLLGAIGSTRDAILYSVDSMTTRGASGLMLEPKWRLMGALESADGMLLFGISTAFIFTVLQQIERIITKAKEAFHEGVGPPKTLLVGESYKI
jgi:uncharacterized membrane protein HdeD (DUF308 family)